jgi:hypothetical protein
MSKGTEGERWTERGNEWSERRTRLVVVHNLVQLESHGANLIHLIRVLDIVANLVVEDACGLDDPV